MKASLLASLFLVIGLVVTLAAPPPETPPSEPLVASAPASSQWTVTYKLKTPEKMAVTETEIRNRKMRLRYSPLMLSTRTIKAPGKMVIYTSYEAGLKSESWVVNGYIYELPFRENENMRINAKGKEDFPEAVWVSAANFRGMVEMKKRKLNFYETDAPESHPQPAPTVQPDNPKAEPTPEKKSIRRAYIDAETHLPVKIETDKMVMTYRFDAPPPTFPEMDARISEQLRPSKR